MKKIIEYRYTSELLLPDFIGQANSLLKNYFPTHAGKRTSREASKRLALQNFLNVKDEEGKTNLDRIYENYTLEEQKTYRAAYYSTKILDYVRPGTELVIEKDKVNNEILSITGKNQFKDQKPFEGFWGDKLEEILNDPGYLPVDNISVDAQPTPQTFSRMNTQCRVWIWCRALNKVLNVSPFVENLSTSVSNDGKFNMTLSSFLDMEDIDYVDEETFFNFPINGLGEKDNIPFFTKYLQQNDIAFIRFEPLVMEKQGSDITNKFEIPFNQLPDQVYDMIGLVDGVSESTSFSSTDSTTSVNGSDFLKLLVEDESYFFPSLIAQGSGSLSVVGAGEQDRWIKRSVVYQKYFLMFQGVFRSISDSLSFVVNQLSNLGVLEERDTLLKFFKNKTKVYRISDANKEYLDSVDAQGVWQIIKLFVDENLQDRRLVDSSLSQPDGQLISFFDKICQKPFAEFYGDTYGDEYNLIVRQPPFTQEAISRFIENNRVIDVVDYETKNLTWNRTYYAWYELIPKASLVGGDINLAADLIPKVHFSRYAEIFGNKSMRVQHNYISNEAYFGEKSAKRRERVRTAIVNDLSYLIECHAYLPFTRRGTITLPYGDRRIKKGTFIRFKPTGEIFYVDAVRNSLSSTPTSVNRTTTLEVSRGMVEKYIKPRKKSLGFTTKPSEGTLTGNIEEGFDLSGVDVVADVEEISYFNIVDTKLIRETLIQTVGETEGRKNVKQIIKTDFGVNNKVFDFFLKRKQFD